MLKTLYAFPLCTDIAPLLLVFIYVSYFLSGSRHKMKCIGIPATATRMFIHRPRRRRSERKDHRKQVTQTNSTTTQRTIAKLETSAIHLFSEKTNVLRSLALL